MFDYIQHFIPNTHDINRNPGIVWLCGEDKCRLAVIAVTLEHILRRQGYATSLIDEDQIDSGLCSDLIARANARPEYFRRVAEAAKLLDHAGLLTLVLVDSADPVSDRIIRGILGDLRFSQVYIQTGDKQSGENNPPCEQVDDVATQAFIAPENPELVIDHQGKRSEDVINRLLAHLAANGSLSHGYSPLASASAVAIDHQSDQGIPIAVAAG
ncbi:MAG: adenylyl-sulfate kinase [Gammaproteobacteria bacterium]|nr:adenylyl-sulfate kinase [Gammaproteobacteria bacterium]